jgi:hypothetical protein
MLICCYIKKKKQKKCCKKSCVYEDSGEKSTLLRIGQEAICFAYWQIICLCFVHALRLCVRLSLKVMGYLI